METVYLFCSITIIVSLGLFWRYWWLNRHNISIVIRFKGKDLDIPVEDFAQIIEIVKKSIKK